MNPCPGYLDGPPWTVEGCPNEHLVRGDGVIVGCFPDEDEGDW